MPELAPAPSTAAATGLTSADMADRVARGWANDLPERTGRSVSDIVRANVFTRINAILGVLLVVVLATGSLINAAFGLLIVANSVVGMVQELRAKRTLDALAIVGEARPRVRRDGVAVAMNRTEVVRDDVIEIFSGEQVIVDGIVVEQIGLEVDESLLTGEADPVHKHLGDQVLSGSHVVAGDGAYRATKVGREAYAAQLAEQASRFTLVNSELRTGINRILAVVTWLLVPAGALTIWTQLSTGEQDWRQSVLGMVAALVPMVPEGLVLLTSIAFAVGVVRLGKRQCLVQELPAIEGLARVDVVCADKTGTLTQPGMRLHSVVGLDERGEPSDDAAVSAREALAQLVTTEPHPNPSLQAVAEAVQPPATSWAETHHAPFTSARKWSGSTFEGHGSWVLGAPDVLLATTSPGVAPAQRLAATGLRVLVLGRAAGPVDAPGAPGPVEPVALVVIEQWVRPDAQQTLGYFAEQGVEVKVISGDNAASVGAVTRSLGIRGGDDPLDAATLPSGIDDLARDPTFAAAVSGHTVFGRVTPDQKRSMVQVLRRDGHTVAMTGDGVNDVLALKEADIGVAMGSGAPATRAVAQLVLLDDRFATLPHVVAEGRRVIGNIERVANLFLTKTVYSVLLALGFGISQTAFPLQPIHVTITGWFTIGIPAFLLSLAPNDERARPGFASRVLTLAVPSGVVVAGCAFATYLLITRSPAPEGPTPAQAATATLASLILVATWVLAVVARPWEPWKLALLAVSAGAYVAIFALPATQQLFLLDTGNHSAMLTALAVGGAGAVLIEISWWIRSRRAEAPAAVFRSRGGRAGRS